MANCVLLLWLPLVIFLLPGKCRSWCHEWNAILYRLRLCRVSKFGFRSAYFQGRALNGFISSTKRGHRTRRQVSVYLTSNRTCRFSGHRSFEPHVTPRSLGLLKWEGKFVKKAGHTKDFWAVPSSQRPLVFRKVSPTAAMASVPFASSQSAIETDHSPACDDGSARGKVLFIIGPTGVGKSRLGIDVCLKLRAMGIKAEIISADSMQVMPKHFRIFTVMKCAGHLHCSML